MQLTAPSLASIMPTGSGWIGGVLTFTGRAGTVRTWMRLDEVLGRPGGYATVRDARIAAALLTRGAERPAAAVARDGDSRYRIYAAHYELQPGIGPVPLAFEHARPATPGGSTLDSWIFAPADGLVEVRDGTKLLLPYVV